MSPRTRIRVFVASVSLNIASGIGYNLTARDVSTWALTAVIIGASLGVAGIAVELGEYRRSWPK